MSGEKKKLSPLISTYVIALALAGVAYVLFQPPLESIRPGTAGLKGLGPRGDDRVQARIWQDPFMAVRDHQEGEKERENDLNLTVNLQTPTPPSGCTSKQIGQTSTIESMI